MRPDTLPTWNGAPRRRRNRAPLAVAALLCATVVLSVGGTLLYTSGKLPFLRASGSSTGAAPTVIVAHPLPHVPAVAGAVPPMQPRTSYAPGTPYAATPCAVATPGTPTLKLNPPSRGQPASGNAQPVASGTLPTCPDGTLPSAHEVCSTIQGLQATQDQVRQAMYTVAVSQPFSFSLIEAIGWQESSWRPDVVACDGGVGLMQMMPDTTTWMNQYDHTDYSDKSLDGNIHLGVNLLLWEYNYYLPFCNQGMPAGQTCDWDTVWPGGTDGATVRQIVISSYNQGIGTTAKYGIQNWNYVNNVMALWQQFLATEK